MRLVRNVLIRLTAEHVPIQTERVGQVHGRIDLEEDCMSHLIASVRSRVFVVLALFLALFPAMMVTTPAQASTYPVTPYTTVNLNYARNIQYYINYQRHLHGLQTVYQSSCPAWFATHWDYNLAQTGLFYHQSMYQILSTCRASVAGGGVAPGEGALPALLSALGNLP